MVPNGTGVAATLSEYRIPKLTLFLGRATARIKFDGALKKRHFALVGKVDFETHIEGTGAESFIREFHVIVLSGVAEGVELDVVCDSAKVWEPEQNALG